MVTKREVVRQNIKIFVFMVVLIVTAGSFQVFLSRDEDPLYSSIDLVDEAVKSEFPGERGTVTGKMSEQLSSGVDVNVGRKRMGVPGVHKEATIAVMPNVDDRESIIFMGWRGLGLLCMILLLMIMFRFLLFWWRRFLSCLRRIMRM